jgi:peptidoglycan/LPS O-acetylase OafA/YrhL
MTKHLLPLTGLCGVAAYAVLIAHAGDSFFAFAPNDPERAIFVRLAYFGISLFFVLSGFVINYNYAALFAREPLKRALREFIAALFLPEFIHSTR